MDRGMIDSVKACLKEEMRMDVIANNLANAAVVGYKKQRISFQDMLDGAAGERQGRTGGPGAAPASPELIRTGFDLTQGDIKQTGNHLDLAIYGDGFFKVMTQEGVRYTRKGNFQLDTQGFLVTQNGDRVLGAGGPLQIGDSPITVDDTGFVYADGQQAGRLDIVSFDRPEAIQGVGRAMFAAPQGSETPAPFETRVKQGYLELANVEIADEMVSMIHSMRAFESYQKAIKVIDEINNRVINEVSRIR